jgi:peptide/nickel transport system substrate-binding protein
MTQGAPSARTATKLAARGLARLAEMAVLAVIACAPPREPPAPGVLTIAEEQAASFQRNFNPLQYASEVRWPARHAMYEPLVIYNPMTGVYVPWLAQGYAWSDDRRRLTFDIRPGVRWSDGAPFSARDVVFTMQLLARHKELDAHALWRYVGAVHAPDAHTVVLDLARRHVQVLEELAEQPIVPEHIWSKIADPLAFANEDPVGTGPFTQVSSFRNQVYEVDRNPLYWQAGSPQVKTLRFRAFPANEQTMLALIGDDLDWAGEFMPAVERIYARRSPHHRYWFPLIDTTVFLYPNTQRKPLDDLRVRKALSLAIDRDLVAKVAMHGYTRASDATGLSDAYTRFRDPTAVAAGDWVAHDPARAAALLDEAGVRRGPDGWRRGPDGAALPLAIQTPAGYSDWVAAAQIIVRGLRQVGIDASVKTNDYQTWFEQLSNGDFMLAVGWSEASATPYGFYHALMASESVLPLGEAAPENWHRFALPEADRLLAQLEETNDPFEEKRLTAGLQRLFVAHAPALPLFPGPLWGEFNSSRFTGFPDAQDPYAPLSPHVEPQSLLVLTRIRPR